PRMPDRRRGAGAGGRADPGGQSGHRGARPSGAPGQRRTGRRHRSQRTGIPGTGPAARRGTGESERIKRTPPGRAKRGPGAFVCFLRNALFRWKAGSDMAAALTENQRPLLLKRKGLVLQHTALQVPYRRAVMAYAPVTVQIMVQYIGAILVGITGRFFDPAGHRKVAGD